MASADDPDTPSWPCDRLRFRRPRPDRRISHVIAALMSRQGARRECLFRPSVPAAHWLVRTIRWYLEALTNGRRFPIRCYETGKSLSRVAQTGVSTAISGQRITGALAARDLGRVSVAGGCSLDGAPHELNRLTPQSRGRSGKPVDLPVHARRPMEQPRTGPPESRAPSAGRARKTAGRVT